MSDSEPEFCRVLLMSAFVVLTPSGAPRILKTQDQPQNGRHPRHVGVALRRFPLVVLILQILFSVGDGRHATATVTQKAIKSPLTVLRDQDIHRLTGDLSSGETRAVSKKTVTNQRPFPFL